MIEEIWEDVTDYEGYYQVSNKGRVKGVERTKMWKGLEIPIQSKILKEGNSKGYKKVNLSKDGIKETLKIHRLVAQTFIPNPDNLSDVNHKDGDKANNCVDNLEWITEQGNTLHAYENGLSTQPKGGKKSGARAINQYNLDNIFIRSWDSIADAVNEGFDYSCIIHCCKGKYKNHKGYVWKYALNTKDTATPLSGASYP